MSGTVERAPRWWRRTVGNSSSGVVVKVLLACGIGYGVLYVVANDVIAAMMFEGYSRVDQAISELSGTDAVTVLLFGALTGMLASGIAAGAPTPGLGLVERISYGAWLLWMGVLAVVLLRAEGPRRAETPEGDRA